MSVKQQSIKHKKYQQQGHRAANVQKINVSSDTKDHTTT